MRTYPINHKWEVVSHVRNETVYGILDQADNVTMSYEIGIDPEDEYGFFEMYDLESGGERFYAEGGIWFEDKTVINYDGVFELSQHIVKKLNELGFNTEEI